MTSPETYDAWYASPRGRWIGAVEYALLKSRLPPLSGASLLDAGCGSGYFTRLFAGETKGLVVGLDPDTGWLEYAASQAANQSLYVAGRAESLPFADKSFDYTVSVTALCFVSDRQQALRELARVTRRRLVLGLLNRYSLLYLDKGRHGGKGAYRGAYWHTPGEVRALMESAGINPVALRSAIVLPRGDVFARAVERVWPQTLLAGGFLLAAGDLPAADGSVQGTGVQR